MAQSFPISGARRMEQPVTDAIMGQYYTPSASIGIIHYVAVHNLSFLFDMGDK